MAPGHGFETFVMEPTKENEGDEFTSLIQSDVAGIAPAEWHGSLDQIVGRYFLHPSLVFILAGFGSGSNVLVFCGWIRA